MKSNLRLVVNAIPLLNIGTGISRYLHCLYSRLEEQFKDEIEFGYFDGISVNSSRPRGPANVTQWSSHVDLFWKLPTLAALALRIMSHYQRELCFSKAAKGYDVYHEAAFFPFVAPERVKTAFTLHDLSLVRFPQFHPKERALFARFFLRRRCKRVDRFMTDSRFIKSEILEHLGVSENRVDVIPLAHDPGIFYPRDTEEVAQTRIRYKLPKSYFMAVGSGDPRKNMDVIPKAMIEAKLETPLVLAGWSGWSENGALEKRTIPLGYVADDDLARLYSGALALVYPTLYEGFGLPVLEAMACGCPVVCSRRASIPEVAGDAALYLENPGKSEELGNLMQTLARDPMLAKDLSCKGLAQASSFSWGKTAQATCRVFRELL